MFAGIAVCAFLLGASWPLLAAMPLLPERVLAGDAFVVTQGSGAASMNETLVDGLRAQAWAEAVSPEVLAFAVLRGQPALVRGVDPAPFAAIERILGLPSAPLAGPWSFVGERLASRLGLAAGDEIVLTGSTVPRIAIFPVLGVLRDDGPAADEVLVSLDSGRFLAGLGSAAVHSVRVRSADLASLLAYLQASGASVHVSGPGMDRADVNSDPPAEGRLTNLLLRSGRGSIPRDYLTSAVADATNSVRVVAWGFAGLIALLVAFGVHAVQGRDFSERRRNVGVLRAVGASDGWVLRRAAAEGLPLAVGSALLGALAGAAAGIFLVPAASIVLFGHEVRPEADVAVLVLLTLVLSGVSLVSRALLVRTALRDRPGDVLRDERPVEPPASLEVVLRS